MVEDGDVLLNFCAVLWCTQGQKKFNFYILAECTLDLLFSLPLILIYESLKIIIIYCNAFFDILI